jgi:aspartate carbamoyltransferase catalytic subunit
LKSGILYNNPDPPMKRDLITIADLSDDEILNVLRAAQRYSSLSLDETRALRGKLKARRCLLMFYEPSTRTRVSFEVAAQTFGMSRCVVTADSSSVAKGESIADTAQTFGAMGFDLAVVRHAADGGVAEFADNFPAPVMNGGSGKAHHPTQALLDAYTLWRRELLHKGLRIAICGDVLHSRVARSNIELLHGFGIVPVLCGPRALMPPELQAEGKAEFVGKEVEVRFNLDEILPELDALMMLRTQLERHSAPGIYSQGDFVAAYQVNAQRLRKLRSDAVLMHPGPVMRGSELTDEAMADPRCAILQQVTNGVHVRMALISMMVR